MNWDKKLKRLQENLGLTSDGLASTLGITTRTLADFMKPGDEGGREPTGPVQRLIDLLSGELDSQGLIKKPQLNLVVIHGDFRVPAGQDAVVAVVDMHAAAGKQLNNEFHYVTVLPERDAQWALEGLVRRRIQPHFFACDKELDTPEARDCYFTATTVWLATQALRRDLAHITLAADVMKFWPLARELKELAEVEVTFVRGDESNRDVSIDSLLQNIGISIADPSGRKLGFVTSLKSTLDSNEIAYGFITPGQKDQDGKPTENGSPLFFSFNHMRKDRNNLREIEITQLVEGDYVSFSIGMNNKGACATDVALVERASDAPPISSPSTGSIRPRSNLPSEKNELLEILKDAVTVCADEEGWTLYANVGTRIKVHCPDFKERLKAATGLQSISQFITAHKSIFEELENGDGKRYKAKCVRLTPSRKS